jgi:cyclopropane fatty-acyl-phospholipid synthase-like methyltransferase
MGKFRYRGKLVNGIMVAKLISQAVRMTNCTVDTITLSSQQKVLAEERIKAAGFAGRIRVWLMDYRK